MCICLQFIKSSGFGIFVVVYKAKRNLPWPRLYFVQILIQIVSQLFAIDASTSEFFKKFINAGDLLILNAKINLHLIT